MILTKKHSLSRPQILQILRIRGSAEADRLRIPILIQDSQLEATPL